MFGRSGRGLVAGVLVALIALAGLGSRNADRLDLPTPDPTTAGAELVDPGDDHVVVVRTHGSDQRHVVRTALVVVVAACLAALAKVPPAAGWWWRRRDHRWAPAPLSGSPAAALRAPPA